MTKIDPPLVEGEWVVAELRDDRGLTRVEGEVELASITGVWVHGSNLAPIDQVLRRGWTILERRPPKPDWADADAILVEWKDGSTAAFPKRDSGSFGFTLPAGWQESLNSARNDIVGIRGLYLRDNS